MLSIKTIEDAITKSQVAYEYEEGMIDVAEPTEINFLSTELNKDHAVVRFTVRDNSWVNVVVVDYKTQAVDYVN